MVKNRILAHYRRGLAGVLYVLSQIGGVLLWLGYIGTWQRWQGGLGFIIGIATFPGIVVFPVIFWFVENRLPMGYCVLWVASLVLFLAAGLLSSDE